MSEFDYENAVYLIYDQEGDERGPFAGKADTKRAAVKWFQVSGSAITVIAKETNEEVAIVWPNGEWMFPDAHDDEGNRLPERREW